MGLLTLDECAEYLKIPRNTLRYWRVRGDTGPHSFKLNNRVVYKRADVDAWVEQQYAASTAGAA